MIRRFKKHLLYQTGHLYVKEKFAPKTVIGTRVGHLNKHCGYIVVGFMGKKYRAHRIIWEILNGPIPDGTIVDHINQDKTDNRIENLRLATKSQNAMNSKKRIGTTKSKGVVKNKYGKFEVYIRINGKGKRLGTYSTEQEAALVYNNAAAKYFGEYANLNKLCTHVAYLKYAPYGEGCYPNYAICEKCGTELKATWSEK